MSNEGEFFKRVHDRFNARDMETVLAAMHEDVIWANGMEGGHVHGRDGVRSYWRRQLSMRTGISELIVYLLGKRIAPRVSNSL